MYADVGRRASLDATATHRGIATNDRCGDHVEVALHIDDERVVRYSYAVRGCALSSASAALVEELIPGLTCEAVTDRVELLEAALQEPRDAPWPRVLESIAALEPLRANRYRHSCVLLAWRAVARAVQDR